MKKNVPEGIHMQSRLTKDSGLQRPLSWSGRLANLRRANKKVMQETEMAEDGGEKTPREVEV